MRTGKGFRKLALVFVAALLLGSVAFIGISPGQASGSGAPEIVHWWPNGTQSDRTILKLGEEISVFLWVEQGTGEGVEALCSFGGDQFNLLPSENNGDMFTAVYTPNQIGNFMVSFYAWRGEELSWVDAHVLVGVRDVEVSISPSYREQVPKATLDYTVTVTNRGSLVDTYDLSASDTAGWGPTLSDNSLENVQLNEERTVTLTITIPEDATSGTEDTITVTATSQADPTVSDSDSSIVHVVSSKAEFSLATLYKVNLDVGLYLENGSKLVVKFYSYVDAFQGENVVWSGSTPDTVSFLKTVPHPGNEAVNKARLDLTTDNTEVVISTISTFVVRKSTLEMRFMEIPADWAAADPAGKTQLEMEFMRIPGWWAGAPY